MIPAAVRLNMTARFDAQISGIVKEVPRMLKPVVKGDKEAVIKLSPAVSCHQGVNREMMTTANVKAPPANPNQFILTAIFLTYIKGTSGTVIFSFMLRLMPLISTFSPVKSTLMVFAPA